jgi:hypothetical protein
MTTYYVSKTGLDVNTGLSGSGAKLTINSALGVATSDGDVVEIIDEGDYNEGNLWPAAANMVIKHTASWLGRPKIYGTGLGGGGGSRAFQPSSTNTTYIGLEISNYSADVFQDLGAGYDKFHMSGCFVHDVPSLGSSRITNTDVSTPTTLKQCIMFFEPGISSPIINGGYMEISNCLITSSNTSLNWPLIEDSSNFGTASFSTIINRGTTSKSTVLLSKVINCIVYSTTAGDGIASDDQDYNLATVPGHAFKNKADLANAATGSNSAFTTYASLGFVDGTAVGGSVTIAPNYDIQASSVAVDAGTAYDGIVVDITGTVRPWGNPPGGTFDIGCFEYMNPWVNQTDEEEFPFSTDFTNNHYSNMNANQKFRFLNNPKQVPFSRGVKGPATLRGRNTPYKAE